jgi:thiamine biosynthesis lipoprotein
VNRATSSISRAALTLFFVSMTCPLSSSRPYVCASCANAIVAGTAARTTAKSIRVEKSDEVMGSTFSVVLYGEYQNALDAAADAAFDEAHRLDRMLSNYKPDSEWSVVNRLAAERPVAVSDELFALLVDCLRYSEQSEGAFDITVGPLMRVWGFYTGEGVMPRREDVRSTLWRVGYRHVRLDSAARTVRFARAGVELDPGGIGKGYAVDRMVEVLRRRNIESAFVSASGSSIYGLGTPPDNPRGWPVAIRGPRDPEAVAAEVLLRDTSISTSGSYEKFFRAAGRTYSHVIDPRTGYPAQGAAAVSVVAPRSIDSEAWTKPYFINGRAWAASHRPDRIHVFYCTDAPRQRCEWIGDRGP